MNIPQTKQEGKRAILDHITRIVHNFDIITLLGLDYDTPLENDTLDMCEDAREEVEIALEAMSKETMK
jgi:hypothetical protein